MDSALAALLGAFIGAAGSLAANWIQQRHQTRRDMIKAATDLGLADFQEALSSARRHGRGSVLPVSTYVYYHAEVLKSLADGKFGPAEIARIDADLKKVIIATAHRD